MRVFQDQFTKYVLQEKREKVGRFLSGDTSVSMTTAQLELQRVCIVGVPTDMGKILMLQESAVILKEVRVCIKNTWVLVMLLLSHQIKLLLN